MMFVIVSSFISILYSGFICCRKNKVWGFYFLFEMVGIIILWKINRIELFYLYYSAIGVIQFTILHFPQRVSIWFYLLFYSCYIGLGYIGYIEQLYIHLSIAQLLVFFLVENHQYLLKKNYEESATTYQNKIIQKQVEEVNNVYLTMRGWRHDYHNHLQTMKAHIKLENYDMVSIYLDELEKDLNQVNNLIETGNVNVDAILNSKLSLAQNHGIEINYKATLPKQLSISDIDLCVLIGNLIDNALEACDKMKEEEQRFIRLYIRILKQQLYISLTNSTNESIKKLDDEYITTKRGNHGHGLKRINLIVEKYDGYINRKNEPGVFVSEILIPLK